jgi:adenine-specific DNA-methyltransferase
MTLNQQYSKLTISITKSLSKKEKKDFGIFITPKIIIEKLFEPLFNYINENNINITSILEPSCGTCEIINYCDNHFNNIEIQGIEYNETIYNSIQNLQFKNNVQIIKQNFMLFNNNSNYDLIVGNPPYFVCKKTDVPTKYSEFCTGRPNIFGCFIIHSLSMLNINGILAFIIPKSFLNSMYYSLIRNYIKKTCKIIDIIDFKEYNEFIDTNQATFGLIVQKLSQPNTEIDECKFSVKINNNFIFAIDSTELKQLFNGSTTLAKMKLKVKTGNIVWNEHKDELTDDENQTLLIYNTNISKHNKFEIKKFKNEEKGQYIKKDGRITPTLVVNRGNGNSAYKLNYALIEKGPYLIENHLNEIYTDKKIDNDELLEIYNKVINSFKNPKTQQFIETFLGNNGLSKTELETIFPIYI